MTILAQIAVTIVLSILRRRLRKIKHEPVPNSGSGEPSMSKAIMFRPPTTTTRQMMFANNGAAEVNSLPTTTTTIPMSFTNKKSFEGLLGEATIGLQDVWFMIWSTTKRWLCWTHNNVYFYICIYNVSSQD